MSKKTLDSAKSPVRVVMTVLADGTPEVLRTAFCKREAEVVPFEHCTTCAHLKALPSAQDADVLCFVAATESPPTHIAALAAKMPVAEVLRRRVICVKETATLEFIEGLMLEQRIDAVPVVSDDDVPVGIVTKSDIVRTSRNVKDSLRNVARGHEHEDGVCSVRESDLRARDIMTKSLHVIPAEAPLSVGIALLALENVDQVPVLSREGKFVGLLATRDVVRWLAKEMGYVVRPAGA